MSLHTWHHQGPCKPSSCANFMLNPHWGRADTGKNVLPLYTQGHLGLSNSCNPVDCGLSGFQARILEHIGQYWLPYPSRALYFMLPWLPTPLSPRCCQSPCNPSSCTTSTPGPHWARLKSSRAASGANPSGLATCRDGKKTTIETQGQCG